MSGLDYNDFMKAAGSNAVRAQLDEEQIPRKGNGADPILAEYLALDGLTRRQETAKFAKELGLTVGDFRDYLRELQPADQADDAPGSALVFEDIEPHPRPVEGAELFTELRETFSRYCVLPDGAATVCALWTMFTWTHDAFGHSPLLSITSPTKRCGKSTLLVVLSGLVKKPLMASNFTSAALFRTVEKWQPTLLIDEADSFGKDNDEIRKAVNGSWTKRGAFIPRCVGDGNDVRIFKTWGPKATGGIGACADTISDRGFGIRMRRKSSGEEVARLRMDHIDFSPLPAMLTRWAEDNLDDLRDADPQIPPGFNDRASDNLRVLLAIAHACGVAETATRAAYKLTPDRDESEPVGVRLLAAIREIAGSMEQIATQALLANLHLRDEEPWQTFNRGQPMTSRQLADLLRPFDVRSGNYWFGDTKARGYKLAAFSDAFRRYLPDLSVPAFQTADSGASERFGAVPDTCRGTDKKRPKLTDSGPWNAGTDKNPGPDEKHTNSDHFLDHHAL